MNFMVTSAHQPPSGMLYLSADRLVLRATKESREREAAEAMRRHQAEEHRKRKGRSGRKRYREEDAYAAAAAAANRTGLRITGTLLRDLCLAEASQGCRAELREAWAADAVKMGCVLLDSTPALALRMGLYCVAPADMAEYLFDVQTELLSPGRLVVLSSWSHLEQVAVMPRLGQRLPSAVYHRRQAHEQVPESPTPLRPQQQAQPAPPPPQQQLQPPTSAEPPSPTGPQPSAPGATTSSSSVAAVAATTAAAASNARPAKADGDAARSAGVRSVPRQELTRPSAPPSTPGRPYTPSGGGRAAVPGGGGSWGLRPHRQEAAVEVVPAQCTSDDIRELNVLIDAGTLTVASTGPELADFLCSQCQQLPVVTLTMTCCGALVCPQCVPAPPLAAAASRAARLCPQCAEEPIVPPLEHPRRDEMLARLVRELRVLYAPQLRALRRRRSQSNVSLTPDRTGMNSPYLMGPPGLGLL